MTKMNRFLNIGALLLSTMAMTAFAAAVIVAFPSDAYAVCKTNCNRDCTMDIWTGTCSGGCNSGKDCNTCGCNRVTVSSCGCVN